MTCDEVKTLIENRIPGSSVDVRDMTGTSDHFDVNVTADAFAGKTLIEQHKIVHLAVDGYMGDGKPIHALKIKTQAT